MKTEEIRQALHRIPELGRKEFQTKQWILNYTENWHCQIFEPTPTAVVLYFDCHKHKTICFRCDMDGLPIEEQNHMEFRSQHMGIMHACGHDGHMAMVLSFAEWANTHLEELEVNVVCLFQPSEEDNAGANDILQSGILDTLHVEEIYGMHIWPGLEEGKLFGMKGQMTATSAEVDIHIYGQSVHAANRKNGIDALWVGTDFIKRYYSFADKIKEPHLIHFGKFQAGTVRNIVAAEAVIEGTMRTFDDRVFEKMLGEMERLKRYYEKTYPIKIEYKKNAVYPGVINDSELFDKYKEELRYFILDKPYIQSEDFGCYTRKYKSLFLLLGCGDKSLLHTATFDFPMDILNVGVEAYKSIAKQK